MSRRRRQQTPRPSHTIRVDQEVYERLVAERDFEAESTFDPAIERLLWTADEDEQPTPDPNTDTRSG